MHESATAYEIAASAANQAREKGLREVRLVRVRLGAWTGHDLEELQEEFQKIRGKAGMPNAVLEIDLVAPKCRCEECGTEYEPDTAVFSLRCNACGSARVSLIDHRELEVEVQA